MFLVKVKGGKRKTGELESLVDKMQFIRIIHRTQNGKNRKQMAWFRMRKWWNDLFGKSIELPILQKLHYTIVIGFCPRLYILRIFKIDPPQIMGNVSAADNGDILISKRLQFFTDFHKFERGFGSVDTDRNNGNIRLRKKMNKHRPNSVIHTMIIGNFSLRKNILYFTYNISGNAGMIGNLGECIGETVKIVYLPIMRRNRGWRRTKMRTENNNGIGLGDSFAKSFERVGEIVLFDSVGWWAVRKKNSGSFHIRNV